MELTDTSQASAKASPSTAVLRRTTLPVCPVLPLLQASERLFSRVDARRFPFFPGSHVVCAAKDATVSGQTSLTRKVVQ
jgi:hypothetical protein